MFKRFTKNRKVKIQAFTPYRELVRNHSLRVGQTLKRSEVPVEHQAQTGLCFGYVKGLRSSITLFAPCDFIVDNTQDQNLQYIFPEGINGSIETMLHDGMERFGENTVSLTKINFPYGFLCEGGHEWVMCSHMLNFSGMIVPSGIIDFTINPMFDVFNLVPLGAKYFVKAGTPIVSLYLRDKRTIDFDLSYDPEAYERLREQRCHFHLKADSLKRQRLRDT